MIHLLCAKLIERRRKTRKWAYMPFLLLTALVFFASPNAFAMGHRVAVKGAYAIADTVAAAVIRQFPKKF